MDARFDKMDARIDKVDAKIDRVDEKLDQVLLALARQGINPTAPVNPNVEQGGNK
jgi:hypothetical protein